MRTSSRPLIGITLDYQEAPTYSRYPWYALRCNYSQSLENLGAMSFPLVPNPDLIDAYLERIDGLLVTGGDFDIDPSWYGESVVSPTVTSNPMRTNFEVPLLKAALARNLPILGICGGMQALNVMQGGTLIQHIPDANPAALDHSQGSKASEGSHRVDVRPGTLLSRCVDGAADIWVNSSHHQAVKTPGAGLVINATAPDGIIEGIEFPDAKFCVGVQWHPEFLCAPTEHKILQAFVAACTSTSC